MSGLLVGSRIVTFDGDPGSPSLDTLWDLADETGVTIFGVSAPFLMSCRKAGITPSRGAIRWVGSTGAPLPAAGFHWVHDTLGVPVSSISGGTDVASAFVGSSPLVPVRAGEISCRGLGWAVEAFTPDGERCPPGVTGELVITQPMPSMPVGFWNDPDHTAYRHAYFEEFPGIWRHGDWITFTEDGACVITGRSDATLNRGGVRLGTSDFYAVVEALPEVADSLVVHLEDRTDAGELGDLLLFVMLAPGAELDDDLVGRIRSGLRRELSPRHMPDEIVAVPAIPRTLSGKKLEVPVKRILTGVAPEQAASRESLADPTSLDWYVARARRIGLMIVERIIAPRARRIGGTAAEVDRLLPFHARRTVGPVHLRRPDGPRRPAAGVRASTCSRIRTSGLATVTYLFDGALDHRDSTGAVQTIEPGGVNWMTAGRGVAHSERTPPDRRPRPDRLAGLQTWVALPGRARGRRPVVPARRRRRDPRARHRRDPRPSSWSAPPTAPRRRCPAHHRSSTPTSISPAGGVVPVTDEHDERAVLVIDGEVTVDGEPIPPRHLAVVAPGTSVIAATRWPSSGDGVRRCLGGATPDLVELRGVDPGADRGGQGRLGRPSIRRGARRTRPGRASRPRRLAQRSRRAGGLGLVAGDVGRDLDQPAGQR